MRCLPYHHALINRSITSGDVNCNTRMLMTKHTTINVASSHHGMSDRLFLLFCFVFMRHTNLPSQTIAPSRHDSSPMLSSIIHYSLLSARRSHSLPGYFFLPQHRSKSAANTSADAAREAVASVSLLLRRLSKPVHDHLVIKLAIQ